MVTETDITWAIADIFRTSPLMNPNYPYGYNCKVCQNMGIECTYEKGDGQECNSAFANWLKRELKKRGTI